jgi:hypothetical protein
VSGLSWLEFPAVPIWGPAVSLCVLFGGALVVPAGPITAKALKDPTSRRSSEPILRCRRLRIRDK